MLSIVLFIIQLFFSIVIGLYFFNILKSQQSSRNAIQKESKKEVEKLKKLRDIRLSQPLSEKTRPSSVDEVIGQEQGIKALRAALCGPNPQHVIIYGPPGVGKTAAARVILEEAKKNLISPFGNNAKFVELDATTLRFDERGIADPLIGSVHDPIYQGAGAYGPAGIPQPKPGAVTKAHGGILFLDEIGELHPIELNKLLKVLEDRKVFFESSYYSAEDANIPQHIHDIFQRGLPADFRLIGATTRLPEDIPPAIRSRCLEIYFKPLTQNEIKKIIRNAAVKGNFLLETEVDELVAKYSANGRDAVNIIQIAGGVALCEGRTTITRSDVEWVIEFGRYSPRADKKVGDKLQVGCINGLAVIGNCVGTIMDIEATSIPVRDKTGSLTITGIVEEEELSGRSNKLKRTSTVRGSISNVLTVMKKYFKIDPFDFDLHINFPGGMPVDGPSAGIAIMSAVYSSMTNTPISEKIALTGEVSIKGKVKPVGGVVAKVQAAKEAGIQKVLIPKENWQELFNSMDIKVVPVENIIQVVKEVFETEHEVDSIPDALSQVFAASGL